MAFMRSFTIDLATVNVDKIQEWIDNGRIDPSIPITLVQLYNSRCIHQVREGVKLLARVRITCFSLLSLPSLLIFFSFFVCLFRCCRPPMRPIAALFWFASSVSRQGQCDEQRRRLQAGEMDMTVYILPAPLTRLG